MTDYGEIYKELKAIDGIEICRNSPLRLYTTFRIGGPAKLLVRPRDVRSLREAVNATKGLKRFILGNGSNFLAPDRGIGDIVIRMAGRPDGFEVNGRRVTVGAGYLVQPLLRHLASLGLSGLEFAAGIPAALGGAVFMNMGARGSEIGKLVEFLDVMDGSGRTRRLSRSELKFSYRRSSIRDCIIVAAGLRFSHKRPSQMKKRISENMIWRRECQPVAVPSAGSVFRNPRDVPAGKLIDMAGLKGLRVGDAEISNKHANFIINLGGASESDVKAIIRKVKQVVKEKFRVKLETEIVDRGRLNMLS